MVRQVTVLLAILVLLCAVSTGAQAASYTPYDGNMNTTYISYFRDIVSGIGLEEHYVAFRSGQYDYIMCVGDIDFSDNGFTLNGAGRLYSITSDDGYNSFLSYDVSETDSFVLDPENKIVYSDLGDYPQLMDRGAKYEILSTILLFVGLLGVVVFRCFRRR